MKSVVFNPVAVDDIEEIVNYIGRDNAAAAEQVRQDILDSAESLGLQPGLGIRPRFSAPRFTWYSLFTFTAISNVSPVLS